MITATILPIFFLYFVLVSGYCAEILNCGLQRYMDRNIMFRHILIFFSIYIFTFVLNWYTFSSLQIQSLSTKEDKKEEEVKKDFITEKMNLHNLAKWFGYSLFIYLIFLISTKSELKYIFILFGYIVFGLIAQILIKSFSTDQYHSFNNELFITEKEYNSKNKDIIILLHNVTSGGFIFTIIALLYGSYKYYLRQYKDHKKKWSWIKFIFGASDKGKECKNL
tara:strand:- start:340 stop:1005 length:666 start_codon:yes stop_codon:yes gene_type:complete